MTEKSPIPFSEKFSPQQELANVWVEKIDSATGETKKFLDHDRVRGYLDRYYKQKEGLATLKSLAIETVMVDPRVQPSELWGLVNEFREELGLSDEQEEVAKTLVKRFGRRQKALDQVDEKYKTDVEKFKFYFGFGPNQDVKVVRGPVNYHFIINSRSDYAALYLGKRPSEVNKDDLKLALKPSGFQLPSSNYFRSNLRGSATVEFNRGRWGKESDPALVRSDRTFKHETHHALKQFWEEAQGQIETGQGVTRRVVDNITDFLGRTKQDVSKYPYLERVLRGLRGTGEQGARGEVFSYFAGGDRVGLIKDYLVRQKEKDMYNYFMELRQELLIELKDKISPNDLAIVKEVSQDIFVIEYKKMLDRGINAYQSLINNGYTPEMAEMFLFDESLDHWPREVRRWRETRSTKLAV